ncbi:crAss001_48 related protein [Psychromonas sp. Urea-02u-13]|uniref:crAss001_48 related protein n=1 Tax=Psychromonas sp. Urea-02u-13 TaxID=2058326 RepID=UPI000C33B2B9|nr:hypothetical protein [Psychromonas sp. Urea-02u-13]PKG39713.1 hypothetical protein CXF74_07105 [Psychromonas sp. Urea-02u-13]
MKNYQKRVVEEKKELDKKISDLKGFLLSDDLRERVLLSEISRLTKQFNLMMGYSEILELRIERFDFEDVA